MNVKNKDLLNVKKGRRHNRTFQKKNNNLQNFSSILAKKIVYPDNKPINIRNLVVVCRGRASFPRAMFSGDIILGKAQCHHHSDHIDFIFHAHWEQAHCFCTL